MSVFMTSRIPSGYYGLLRACFRPCVQRGLHLAPPFLVEDYVSVANMSNRVGGVLEDRVQLALEELRQCRLCPRNCAVDRLTPDSDKERDEGRSEHQGKQRRMAACGTGRNAIVSAAFPHFGEESVLQGWNGSGTIFFGMCNLRCVFCQNWDISQSAVSKSGHVLDKYAIADLMLRLEQESKCHNINLVTPEHVVPQVIEALVEAVNQGLSLPVVYNTSSYDSLRSLELLDGLVDIYLPDFKFWSPESSQRLCKARDYPDVSRCSILEMHRQVGDLVFDAQGLAKKGLILRHLVMPGMEEEAMAIMDFVASHVSKDTYVNVMEQYRPDFKVGGKKEMRARGGLTNYSDIDRHVQLEEVNRVRDYAREIGLWRFEENIWLDKPMQM